MKPSPPFYTPPDRNTSTSSALNGSQNLNGAAATAASADPDQARQSSALDHALLESLFYNEMMMLNAQSPSSSNIISQQLHEAATHPITTDANEFAEKEMLHDFGVTASPMILQTPPTPRRENCVPSGAATPINSNVVQSQSTTNASVEVTSHASICPQPSSLPPASRDSLSMLDSVTSSCARPLQPKSANIAISAPALSIEAPVPHNRARQLVDQFATMASRLGIELPNHVLQQLTTAAAKNDPALSATTIPEVMNRVRLHPVAVAEVAATPNNTQIIRAPYPPRGINGAIRAISIAPTVEELRKTADQAIAAATRKRPAEEEKDSSTSPNNKPIHSKRRKKPRLSDCEQKLAQLKAENEVLKRHLQNVSNKAHQIEQGKEESARRIKQLHDDKAGPEEMNKVVKEMTDMYSDYGTTRQKELSFHLEQLSRLVIPTNFTKLGLWTLGENNSNPKRNPIAGILQKELDITTQQGRKIVEQSEKIKAVCDNLKECLALLAKLKSLCEQKTQIFHHRMAKCSEILTTTQTVKLILWINEHYQILEQVCPGWGTEHIR